jgi:hypothetical protein
MKRNLENQQKVAGQMVVVGDGKKIMPDSYVNAPSFFNSNE